VIFDQIAGVFSHDLIVHLLTNARLVVKSFAMFSLAVAGGDQGNDLQLERFIHFDLVLMIA
jgi:hypothetical protein